MKTAKAMLLNCLENGDFLEASLWVGQIQDSAFTIDRQLNLLEHAVEQARLRAAPSQEDPIAIVEAINHVLFDVLEIQGKTEKYKQVIDDPHRYYLHEVLERRTASPLAVSVLYFAFAKSLGLVCECLALPSHYLLRVPTMAGDFYVDMFDQGKPLNQDEFQKKFRSALHKSRMLSSNLFERLDPSQLVARMVQQLKHIYILKSQAVEALRAVEILASLYPENPEHKRDRGVLYCEMEYFSKAMEDLQHYLKVLPQAEDIPEIKKLTQMLKDYREIVN